MSWYLEPSQPQRIASGLKTNFSLSPDYSAHESSHHRSSKIDKISPDTNLYKTKTYIHKHQTQKFRRDQGRETQREWKALCGRQRQTEPGHKETKPGHTHRKSNYTQWIYAVQQQRQPAREIEAQTAATLWALGKTGTFFIHSYSDNSTTNQVCLK